MPQKYKVKIEWQEASVLAELILKSYARNLSTLVKKVTFIKMHFPIIRIKTGWIFICEHMNDFISILILVQKTHIKSKSGDRQA